MSGPFRFNQQSAQSPLERAASPFSAGAQPVSYKTNVNRAKTRKWVEAKKNAYDGDDWGEYDEYDEYGVDTTPPPEPAPLSSPRYYGQRPPLDAPSRSFTDPTRQAPLPRARKNSFDAGEEQRSFSASIPHPQQQGYAPQPQDAQPPPPLQTGEMGRGITDSSPQTQDFSPSALPQPLQTRISTAPVDIHGSPATTQFPPRKSSIGQASAPTGPTDFIPTATSPRERTSSQDKPLPFIRPADIYKRVEEERRRESIESQSRPSLDSLSSRPKDEPTSPLTDRRNLQPLQTVAERKSEYLPDLNLGQQQDDKSDPQRPQHDRGPSALEGISTFDNSFWSSGPDLQAPASHAPVVSPPQDQGFRSVVDQAFTRSDDQRSVPPTPISKDSDSDLNRSNTGSTSGISPIMSRVPGSAALKNRSLGDGSTPVIAEEPHEAGATVSRPTSATFSQVPQPSQGHTRNLSSTSLPRSDLATPTRGDSPARSPVFGPQKILPEPETAQIATDSTDSPATTEGGPGGPQSAYATREADIASAMLGSPVRAIPELSAAEKQSQDAFLESHNTQSPISDALPRDRSESPSKGRVQALAGKFGDVSHSRRGSTQSNISRNSVQSWERSQNNSRAPSPTKGSPGKPGSPKKEFRPHLPGGWDSYAITTPAPLDQAEAEKGLGSDMNQDSSASTQADRTELDRGRVLEKADASSTLADVDLTPTTKKYQAGEIEHPASDPISALKDAGVAMTASFRTPAGSGDSSTEAGHEQSRLSHGEVYMPRPLHMERAESTVSTIPPTPPAKDTPEAEFPPTPPLKQHSPERLARPEQATTLQQRSSDPSTDDQESDRLREEIVASLSPSRMSTIPPADPDHTSLRPDSKGADRASSILDSYYADLERDFSRTSNDLNRDIPELAPLKSASSAHSATPQKPVALSRFSWEVNSPNVTTPEKQAQSASIPGPTDAPQAEKSSLTPMKQDGEEKQSHLDDDIPKDPYFGPSHTLTVTKPEPMSDGELAARAPTPPLDTGASLHSPPTREQTRSPGLHIVNSALDPEAVDLPPRWSAEHSLQTPKDDEKEVGKESPPPQQLNDQQTTNPAVSAHTAVTGTLEAAESSAVHEPDSKTPTSPRSPTSDKPLGAREIATIGSTAERIATYNKTRDQWANTDHGLSNWITATFDADPSLATQSAQPLPQARPQSGTFRHKHTGSLNMLGKFTGSSNNHSSGGAYYEQYNSAAAQVPTSSNSPTAGPSKTSSSFLGRTASHSIQTQQMQAKGKDLLHTAGVLSGKGMTSAKGLFAKGKSRFNRDKESSQPREASEQLEILPSPTTSKSAITPSPTTNDYSRETQRRRRLSSPFRRSRSRPRSAGAAFPSTTSLVSSPSLTAVPNDIPDLPKAFQGRPHSYHAPDLSLHPAYRGATNQLILTSPSYERGCTVVQPAPTRSSFVTETEVQDDTVPPVPPIPVDMKAERRGRRSRSWGNASLMVQSAIRHTTPPAATSRSLGASPIITQFDAPTDEHGKNVPSRTRHSTPITKGLWMGDSSPVLSKRTPTKFEGIEDDETRHSALPMNADETLASEDFVERSEHHDGTLGVQPQQFSKTIESPVHFDPSKELHQESSVHSVLGSRIPWPGTLFSTSERDLSSQQQLEGKDEAPLPQEFVMHFSGDISPLLHSSKASLQEVSDDEEGMWSPTGAGLATGEHELPEYRVEDIGVPPVPEKDATKLHLFRYESGSSHTITKDEQSEQTTYKTQTIGLGDVSPTSDHADTSSIRKASNQALDMQSALETKVIGAGDVSPISTRSSGFIATSLDESKDGDRSKEPSKESAKPRIERFYTADNSLDLVPLEPSKVGEDTAERPRIERFETAHESVQGPSELTDSNVRHPASRYAHVLASEPVVSYKEYTGSSSSSSDDLLEVTKPQARGGAMTPQRAELLGADMPAATRRVSASQLQVVHAVEEYAASNSSFGSWDHDSNAADAISEPVVAVDMKDESDLVTPVAQVPSNAAHQRQQADQAGNFDKNSSYAAPNGYFNDPSTTNSLHQGQQTTASTSNMTVPERSKSLLSIISSAVSSTPISPASSNAGRSTPSTIHRMQRDFSNAKRSNLTEVQIPEEPTSAKDDQTPTARHEDYDLYADHNGVVKDVRDGNGQPLRLASTPNAAPVQLARTTTETSSNATAPDVQDSPGRRYSFERPMSFISGSQDDDGRPQDQINQPLAGSMAAPPVPPQSKRRSQQYPRAPSGAIYSNFEPVQDTHWPPGEVPSQPPVPSQRPAPSAQPQVQEYPPAKVVRQATRFVPHAHRAEDGDEDETAQHITSRAGQGLPASLPPAPPAANGQPTLNGYSQDQHAHDPRIAHGPHVQPRSVSAPLQQMVMPVPDPRVVSQPLGSPPVGPPAGSRDESEYQQQMMQLQAKYPRFRGAESQAGNMQQPGPIQQASQAQEKPSAKPRLAAAIKGIVGRTSPNAPHVSNAPPAPSTLAPTAPPTENSRAESFVSAVSSMSREPPASMPSAPPSTVAGPQRPPSLGAESHYSHVSQGSTQVQPAQSRQDLTMPAVPAQYHSLHPQQQPQQHLQIAPPKQGVPTHDYRASTGAMPDAGKKKRFSAFTGLFGKGNAAAELQGKFKLTREEKKAQKAQRHTSQPALQSPPMQTWPPPQKQNFATQQPDRLAGQGLPPAGYAAQAGDPRFMTVHGPPQMHSQGPPGMRPPQALHQQHQQQPYAQQGHLLQQQQRPNVQPDEGSAYLRTKQMAEEHRARQAAGQAPRPVYENPSSVGSVPRPSSEQPQQLGRQSVQRPPSNGYYYPEKPSPEPGAYATSQEEQQRALQLKQQQQLETERRLNPGLPRSPGDQGAYGASAASRQQAEQQQRPPSIEQGAYGATHEERQRLQQHNNYPLPSPEAFGRSQIHYDQIQQHGPPQRTVVPLQHERQQIPQSQMQSVMTREEHMRQAEEELAHHRWQQQQIQLRQFHLQQQAQLAQQQAPNRSASGPLLSQASPPASPVAQRHVSSPVPEPQYDTPPIPGAYGHVQGVFVSPLDQPHAYTTPHDQFRRQGSDPHMQPISPQVSAPSQMSPNARHHSDASSVSVISPISGSAPEPFAPGQTPDPRLQKPRMPSISEVHQQTPPQERPWHMNFPAGTTEQDIVRARQKQFFQQQFASQQQAQAERHASSPSPRVSPDKQSPPFSAPLQQPQEQGGGFREVLPRKSPQPYSAPLSAPLDRRSPRSSQQTPSHPNQGAGWPLHSSPGSTEAQRTPAGPQPLSNETHTPRQPRDFDQRPPYVEDPRHTAYDQRQYEPTPPNESQRGPPPDQQLQYDENVPDEAPPSYDGPGVPNDGMEKSNPDRPRPPNIVTATSDRGRQPDGRPRQASLGLMQHPQPASMAASPQRTAPDMGAESLRRQMLQQEEHARMERIQRSQMQAAQRQREQQERDAARARARELERSVSGGGRVGSLRSVRGSHNGGTPGWERRVQGGSSRPVFELPAVEDEEPVMRATSFPGQEWVPPMYVDD